MIDNAEEEAARLMLVFVVQIAAAVATEAASWERVTPNSGQVQWVSMGNL